MIILDTNVISELMRDPGDAAVSAWLDRQPVRSVWTTSITVFEIRFGIEKLPMGRRREALFAAQERLTREVLERRILAYDEPAAIETAKLMAERQGGGRPAGVVDGMIAGIVRAHRATFATRNTRHFEDAGIDLVDPWVARPGR